ncbi:MAG: ADP-forming succinate--CoA ligase subunit beta [Verrucomicrobia bacterium CG_4_10_14_3_um_filter_43_23]|nr:MAG: succinate--CoA ligase subunit beta [Verrucomicrobia bacterium CG1_02_43_26]PIP59844.1 MAG: ADP-forming succinate--CoA ligase subunit beta [Verrucomicrobia bacterium CG22_combo_CG10-13_8_21_14_all_43_17]PIX57856.1 MAG: ADP-forming succinate--CoA ligase subunit beta [Verrucomicrobia bacterium CG_4_10_14_3_um_filter_43_23]PIY63061.1 MAG: ADP-forming succinate--CoA ligase subunit beta [Verrucomicrobia bacterium CG_4_10_14_0_8_um_filter_43_34]PJA43691.1 MAG: ADP-forming succinate--CoA ligase
MNIHEYQAKQLFEEYGVPVAKGTAVKAPDQFPSALSEFSEGMLVVKSQIHAGGRGKGTFVDGYKGGVKLAKSKDEAREIAHAMLGNTLVTHQTGSEGRKVQTVYFTEANDIEKEYYLAILLDRATSKHIIIASTEGGVDIETVAEETPEKIIKISIDPLLGLMPYQAREVAFGLGFESDQVKQMVKLLLNLYRLYAEKDCSMVEINPLITTPAGLVLALDAKVSFDDNALFRHRDIQNLRDLNEEDPKEIEASKAELNYIALDGNIACMVNGAGLAMATMDIIKYFGGNPANFLDVGGGANEEQVTAAFNIILSDKNVKGILVNIFGGIMRCDVIAKGIIAAAKNVSISVPLVVRLEGTNVDAGKKLLEESGLSLTSASSLAEAAQKIVALVAGK